MAGRSACALLGRFPLIGPLNRSVLPGLAEAWWKRDYAMKSPVPIKWVRPEKIPCIHPKKSGDLQPLNPVDSSRLAPEFEASEELKTANEYVKRVFTLEFLPYKKSVETMRSESANLVKRHELDINSPEVRLAKMTVNIRDMQAFMEKNPMDKKTKVILKETIDKRRRLLKYLRTWDYKRFEWVLEKLNIVYKPYPGPEVYKRVERKRSLRMLTKQYCSDIVSKKISEYRSSLESQQEEFLTQKIKTLEWIMKEESACEAEPTVVQADVDKAKEQLQQLLAAKKQPAVAS